MVDSINIYKYLNIDIGTVIKNPEFVSDHFKTKKMCKIAVKKSLHLIMFLINIRLNKCVRKMF